MKLLRLKPELNGRAGPESLSFYVVRLADVHGITPHQLLRVLASRDKSSPGSFTTGPLQEILSALNGYGDSTRSWISRLSRATGALGLEACTLIELHGLLARNVNGMLKNGRQWCPRCYHDDPLHYEPLSWLLSDVKTCSIHGVNLVSRCSSCDSSQHVLTEVPRRRHCQACGNLLLNESILEQHDPETAWREAETLRLLAHLGDGKASVSPTATGFKCFLKEFIDPRSSKLRDLARTIGVDTSNLRRFLTGESVPSWDTVLRAGMSLRVSPTDILLHPKKAGQFSFDFGSARTYRRSRLPASKGTREALQNKLLQLMDNPPVQLSLAEVCRSLGIRKSRAHHLDSKLVATYGQLHYKWLCEQRLSKFEACARAASEAAPLLQRHPIPFIVTRLMKKTGLPKQHLYRELKAAANQLATGPAPIENGRNPLLRIADAGSD